MLRDDEFTDLSGIETQWIFIPIGSLQEKLNAESLAASGTFDVVGQLSGKNAGLSVARIRSCSSTAST